MKTETLTFKRKFLKPHRQHTRPGSTHLSLADAVLHKQAVSGIHWQMLAPVLHCNAT
jgi:hypothetical protein